MSGEVRNAGDAGLLLRLGTTIDPATNARVLAVAEAFRQRALAGVRDVVPTYHSVAVHFDPSVANRESLKSVLATLADERGAPASGRRIDVPVEYGGEHGPDLEAVSAFAGLPARDVIRLHSSREYRVFMLGFTPGFPYMGSVDGAIAAPRHATPRLRVAEGSVGIAGSQTGIYPSISPGGWQIIGRTTLTLFDVHRQRPALFSAGDRVTFVDAGRLEAPVPVPALAPARRQAMSEQSTTPITVVRPGLFTTIQDAGRWGYQSSGVPVAGGMDTVSLKAANSAVGNEAGAAALEVTVLGPELRVERRSVVAVSGADLGATVDGRALPRNTPVACDAGTHLRFGARRHGGRAYLAIEGGFGVPLVLGSRSTCVRASMGGVDGRPLRAGDRLAANVGRGLSAPEVGRGLSAPADGRRADTSFTDGPAASPGGVTTLRVLRGPHEEWFDDGAFERLAQCRFIVQRDSDRMGFRLSGDERIPRRSDEEMISDAAFTGAVQVPPSGQPILLMADRPTTGGYPQIAIVISADLPRAGQLVPGDRIRFAFCSLVEADAALRGQGDAAA